MRVFDPRRLRESPTSRFSPEGGAHRCICFCWYSPALMQGLQVSEAIKRGVRAVGSGE